jgi:hypothetical protein
MTDPQQPILGKAFVGEQPILGKALTADAKNRALRTFLQGLAIDLAVAVAALILANVDSITDRDGLVLFGIALGKTVVTTAASYVMRRYVDKSSLPTPLPPAPVPEPNEDARPILGKA